MKKLLKKKDLIILLVLIVILISLIPFYILKIRDIIYSNKFATYSYETYTNYTNPIFSIEKIVYYRNIGQYTDIAIYINNTNASDELTDKNTIAELYIDNIKVTSNSNKGTKTLCYKNPYYFATYKGLQEPENGRINFNIITNNKDNKESAYNNPSFYQDCSNPISLGYINKDIVTNFEIANTDTLSLNGTILQKANITLDELTFNMSFTIHIKNNKGEEFICNVDRPVLSDETSSQLLNGYIATQYSPDKGTAQFIKISD